MSRIYCYFSGKFLFHFLSNYQNLLSFPDIFSRVKPEIDNNPFWWCNTTIIFNFSLIFTFHYAAILTRVTIIAFPRSTLALTETDRVTYRPRREDENTEDDAPSSFLAPRSLSSSENCIRYSERACCTYVRETSDFTGTSNKKPLQYRTSNTVNAKVLRWLQIQVIVIIFILLLNSHYYSLKYNVTLNLHISFTINAVIHNRDKNI